VTKLNLINEQRRVVASSYVNNVNYKEILPDSPVSFALVGNRDDARENLSGSEQRERERERERRGSV